METAIRWYPNSTLSDQRFLFVDVNGRSFHLGHIKHYSPNSTKRFSSKLAPAYRKVPSFRAFDWAPFDESLVAVGTPSGETCVLRIDDNAQPISFPAKYQRLCNAVALGRTGLLANGLERVRNDFCLNIWNVSQRLSTVSSPDARVGKAFVEPYRKFASSESISSIKFFPTQPEVLIAGVKGIGIRIYDLRENTGNPSLQFQTPYVHNIAIDPLDENYYACTSPGKDTTIQIWDCRSGLPYTASTLSSSQGSGNDHVNQPGPVLTYPDVFNVSKKAAQASIWSLRYCKGKGGFLGALASNGDFRVFETQQSYSTVDEQYTTHQGLAYNVVNSFPTRVSTRRIHHIERAFDELPESRLERQRIVAFDFTNLAGSRGTPCAIVLRGDQSVDIQELSGPPSALSFSCRGGLVVSKVNKTRDRILTKADGEKFLVDAVRRINPKQDDNTADLLNGLRLRQCNSERPSWQKPRDAEGSNSVNKSPPSSREAHEQRIGIHGPKEQKSGLDDALAFTDIARHRCGEGYGLDSEKNLGILLDDPWLQHMWTWIGDAKRNAEGDVMVAEELDFSYLGVYNIWNWDLGIEESSRRASVSEANARVANAVIFLAEDLQLPKYKGVNSGFPEHRQLCLRICGLGLADKQLEETVKGFVQNGQNTKAAALAIIHDQPKLAFNALRNGNSLPAHRELAIALAGYVKGSTDETWEETIRDLLKDVDDPYARAILALVTDGDWHDVLTVTSLPLRDRVGIALMYLDDEELTQYIRTATFEAIEEGDVEGVVLTGLSDKAITLFEKYILKFSDLQSATLALSFASYRFSTDHRIITWRETYRSYMNQWRMFSARALFDMQATKLSKPPNGRPTLPPVPRQVTLRCNFCDQSIDHNLDNVDATATSISHQGSIFGDAKSGTICPKCGSHMPRCVICMKWMGVADAHEKSGVAANVGKQKSLENTTTVCQACWHMSHGAEAEEWFSLHEECPVSGCGCRCYEIDVGVG